MTNSEIKIVDGKNIVLSLKGLAIKIADSVFDELVIGANDIRNRIIKSMENTRTAPWWYSRGGKRHYPSAPGNPPAIDSGELVSRIITDVRDDEIEVGAAAGAPYAEALEFGTFGKASGRSGSRTGIMAPRPFLFPAVEAEKDSIESNIMAAMAAAVEDALK